MDIPKDLTKIQIASEVLEMVSPAAAAAYQFLPLALEADGDSQVLVVGFSGLAVLKNLKKIEEMVELRIRPIPYPEEIIKEAIEYHFGVQATPDSNAKTEKKPVTASDEYSESVITSLVNKVIRTAIDAKASDIHLLPSDLDEKTIALFREDGKIFEYTDRFNISSSEYKKFCNKIKTMCDPQLDISMSRVPQDGSFRFVLDEIQEIDCRVNTIPTIDGEKLNIRLFDINEKLRSIEDLGFTEADVGMLRRLLSRPSGMILVSAPTGHGKSTTIHAMMREFNPRKTIAIAIEDPVEERLKGIAQVQVHNVEEEKISLTFAKALRACMRQDPNVLAVGEIRDAETAKVAIAASQTGHMFFSTVHARDSISSLARVLEMGVPRGDFLREMVCIISQRLVSPNCPHCSQPYVPPKELLAYLTAEEQNIVLGGSPQKGVGCPECRDRGFVGRIAVPEYIVFDNEVRDFMALDHGIEETIGYLKSHKGYVSMWDRGLDMVRSGRVSLEEMASIIAPDR